jgi:hypothetical protein
MAFAQRHAHMVVRVSLPRWPMSFSKAHGRLAVSRALGGLLGFDRLGWLGFGSGRSPLSPFSLKPGVWVGAFVPKKECLNNGCLKLRSDLDPAAS